MKKTISIILVFVLILSMVFTVPASASEPETGVYDKTINASGTKLDFQTGSGGNPSACLGTLSGNVSGNAVYLKDVGKINLQFTGTANKDYMVYLLKPVGGVTADTLANGNIAYVWKVNSSTSTYECVINPTSLTQTGLYKVLVAGPGLGSGGTEGNKVVATFKVGEFSNGSPVNTTQLTAIQSSDKSYTDISDVKAALESVTIVETNLNTTKVTKDDSGWANVTAAFSGTPAKGNNNSVNVTYNNGTSISTTISITLYEKLTKALFDIDLASKTYDGNTKEPSIVAKSEKGLTKNTHYKVKYSVASGSTGKLSSSGLPLGAGKYDVTVYTTNAGNGIYYDGSFTEAFEITKADQPSSSIVLQMNNYTTGKTPSNPSMTNVKDNATVTYYYSTENNNTSGSAWSSSIGKNLAAGEYYMYAKIASTKNYNAYTTQPVKFTVYEKSSSGIFAIFTNLIQSLLKLLSSIFSFGK